MDDRGFTLARTIGDPPKLERWERPATDEEAAELFEQLQQTHLERDLSKAEVEAELVEARSLIRVVEFRRPDGTVVRGPSVRRSFTRREQALVADAREMIREVREQRANAKQREEEREAERARILEERQLPADWGFDGDEGLPSHGGPLFFDAIDGYCLNQLSARDANTIAGFAFDRSRFLFDLAEKGEAVTFTPHEIWAIANGFESIGFNLGDGVAFDFADDPVWPRHYRAFCDCVPSDVRSEMRKTGEVAGDKDCPTCHGSGGVLEPLSPVDDTPGS